jgi:hypothetical protein
LTGTIDMFDAIDVSQYPPAGPGVCFAGYVDGNLADQPDYQWLVRNRPGSPVLSIALNPADDAQCLDVEAGAATPQSAAGWHERQKARGIARPCLYADASTMESDVVPVITAAGIARGAVRLWSAHYGSPLGAHICGPSTCKATSIDMDGTQWTDQAMGRNLDQSLLLANFFGDPKPTAESWEDKLMATIPTVKQGSADRQAVMNWQGLLVARGYDLGTTGERSDGVDGSFGDVTGRATRDFQSAKGIGVDGVVGKDTWSAALS